MRNLYFVALLVGAVTPCFAQGGAVPVRIPVTDGQRGRCINSNTDKIWLTLRRLVTTKRKGWFTKDKSVAGIINATVKAEPQPAKPIVFPLLTEGTFGDASEGQVSVPLEYTLVSGLTLRQSTVLYTGLGVEITLLNRRGKNEWGNALAALSEITKKMPIPSTPLTQSASYLMDFANAAVTKDVEGQEIDDKVKSAGLALNFDPTGACGGPSPDGSDFETTGTIAVLQEDGVQGTEYVDIARTNDYCWSADLRPAFVLKAATKQAGVPCTDARYARRYQQITNNYLGFFLNAIRETHVSGPGKSADMTESVERCLANGIDASECLR